MFHKNGFDPQTGTWNDSLTGNFLWSNTNIGETISDVLTPYTWSIIHASFEQMNILPAFPVIGNIGGRAYNNVSVMATALRALGRDLDTLNTEMGGVREEYLGNLERMIPPLPKPAILPLIWRGFKIRRRQNAGAKRILRFLEHNPAWCREQRQAILEITNQDDLASRYLEIESYTLGSFWMVVSSAWRYGELTGKVRRQLIPLVDREEADILLSNVSRDTELLSSLGPAIGLSRVARGELSPEAYLEQWGHRGPHETEVSSPRPCEDPDWLTQQLDTLSKAEVDAEDLLTKRKADFTAAWNRFRERHPIQSETIEPLLDEAAEALRAREAVRNELVRLVWVGRVWGLQAGKMTGLGEGIFFLTKDEALDYLLGKDAPVETIPARTDTHRKYAALPPYPMVIRGAFDPFQWASDPDRRSDYYDSSGIMDQIWAEADQAEPSRRLHILGSPGSAGTVEGTVRVLENPEQGPSLKPGEILVATQTNIGWSPFFPLAAAVVTDVGAALSHAAIVARELGIPAVVNCGDATSRLKTGDRVRVDGGRGIVEILSKTEEQ